jgi:hypothetical protein
MRDGGVLVRVVFHIFAVTDDGISAVRAPPARTRGMALGRPRLGIQAK